MSDEYWDDPFDENETLNLSEDEKQKRRTEHRWNEAARITFERQRDARQAQLANEQRIRTIATEEAQKAISVPLGSLLIVGIGYEYGFLAGCAVGAAALLWLWFQDRAERRRFDYRIGEIDELAEDTATHNRISQIAEAGEEWVIVKGDYLEWTNMFVHPFWNDVNAKVREYRRMSHTKRLKDNRAARNKSLPYRRATEAKLKASRSDWQLPHWAALGSGESG